MKKLKPKERRILQIEHALKQATTWDEKYRLHVELAAIRAGMSLAEAARMRKDVGKKNGPVS